MIHGGLNDGYQGTRPLPFNEAGGDRGLFMAGESPTLRSLINKITISTDGNAADFGDLAVHDVMVDQEEEAKQEVLL